jgi:hypothetical protein
MVRRCSATVPRMSRYRSVSSVYCSRYWKAPAFVPRGDGSLTRSATNIASPFLLSTRALCSIFSHTWPHMAHLRGVPDVYGYRRRQRPNHGHTSQPNAVQTSSLARSSTMFLVLCSHMASDSHKISLNGSFSIHKHSWGLFIIDLCLRGAADSVGHLTRVQRAPKNTKIWASRVHICIIWPENICINDF